MFSMTDIPPMKNGAWRDRLAAAIETSGKSKRAISLAAGNNPGYVHSILSEGKDPTIDNLIAVCRVIGVSLSEVVYGFDISPETEELMAELSAAAPEDRAAMLTLLRKKAAS